LVPWLVLDSRPSFFLVLLSHPPKIVIPFPDKAEVPISEFPQSGAMHPPGRDNLISTVFICYSFKNAKKA